MKNHNLRRLPSLSVKSRTSKTGTEKKEFLWPFICKLRGDEKQWERVGKIWKKAWAGIVERMHELKRVWRVECS